MARLRGRPRSRSESESEEGGKSRGVDPKPGELPMARVKSRETGMEARTTLALKSYGMSCG